MGSLFLQKENIACYKIFLLYGTTWEHLQFEAKVEQWGIKRLERDHLVVN